MPPHCRRTAPSAPVSSTGPAALSKPLPLCEPSEPVHTSNFSLRFGDAPNPSASAASAASASSATFSRMELNTNKAGMAGVDKDKVNRVIKATSEGSKFWVRSDQPPSWIRLPPPPAPRLPPRLSRGRGKESSRSARTPMQAVGFACLVASAPALPPHGAVRSLSQHHHRHHGFTPTPYMLFRHPSFTCCL